jgi:hypothetical protein
MYSTINILKEYYKTKTIPLVLNEPYNTLGDIFDYDVASKSCFRLTYKCRVLVHTAHTVCVCVCVCVFIYINPGVHKLNKNLEAISNF